MKVIVCLIVLTFYSASVFGQANGRNVTKVYYSGGSFQLVESGKWVEYTRNGQFNFIERIRDDWSVYLYDGSRQTSVQLDLHKKEIYMNYETSNQKLYDITNTEPPLANANSSNSTYQTVPNQTTYSNNFQGNNSGLILQMFDPNSYYFIKHHSTGKYLEVADGSHQNGTRIILNDKHGGDNQLFRFVSMGSDNVFGEYVSIISKHSGKAINVQPPNSQTYSEAVQWDFHGGDNQKFFLIMGNNGFIISAKHSLKTLSIIHAPYRAPLTEYGSYMDKSAQGYTFERFEQVSSLSPTAPSLMKPVQDQIMDYQIGSTWLFQWSNMSGATGYEILVSPDKTGQKVIFNQIIEQNQPVYAHYVTSILPREQFVEVWQSNPQYRLVSWWVRARYINGWGPWSAPNSMYVLVGSY